MKKRLKAENKELNITSLIDILTILLVFMIKNVSMDAQKLTSPTGMKLPLSVTREQVIEKGNVVLVKVYKDKLLVGTDSNYAGKPDELIRNINNTRDTILQLLKQEATLIKAKNKEAIPCLMVQADNKVETRCITQLILTSAEASFSNIYLSSIEADKDDVLGV
jgi:biopolymer transport protein ExbD